MQVYVQKTGSDLACNVHEFVCVCMCVCARVCVCVCVCVCIVCTIIRQMFAMVCVAHVCKCMYSGPILWGDKHDVCTSYGTLHVATCTCTYVQSKEIYREPVTWELHLHEELSKEYSFIYTMCACA